MKPRKLLYMPQHTIHTHPRPHIPRPHIHLPTHTLAHTYLVGGRPASQLTVDRQPPKSLHFPSDPRIGVQAFPRKAKLTQCGDSSECVWRGNNGAIGGRTTTDVPKATFANVVVKYVQKVGMVMGMNLLIRSLRNTSGRLYQEMYVHQEIIN